MKKLLLLALVFSMYFWGCSQPSATPSTARDLDTSTRDTAIFPNKTYPLRMIEVEFRSDYGGNNRADVVFIKNMADTAVNYSGWKTRVASSVIVSSLGSIAFGTVGAPIP